MALRRRALSELNSGVYRIICTANKSFYVGSSVNLRGRRISHFSLLNRKRHPNKHLQNSFNKHGLRSFVFEVIEVCVPSKCLEVEQRYLDELKPLMNNSPTATNRLGFQHSTKTRALLSILAQSPERLERLREQAWAMRGKPAHNRGKPGTPWTPEMKAAASIKRKGRPPWNVGIPASPESNEKRRLKQTGMRLSITEEQIKKVAELRAAGLSYPKISKETGMSIAHCYRLDPLPKIGRGHRPVAAPGAQ